MTIKHLEAYILYCLIQNLKEEKRFKTKGNASSKTNIRSKDKYLEKIKKKDVKVDENVLDEFVEVYLKKLNDFNKSNPNDKFTAKIFDNPEFFKEFINQLNMKPNSEMSLEELNNEKISSWQNILTARETLDQSLIRQENYGPKLSDKERIESLHDYFDPSIKKIPRINDFLDSDECNAFQNKCTELNLKETTLYNQLFKNKYRRKPFIICISSLLGFILIRKFYEESSFYYKLSETIAKNYLECVFIDELITENDYNFYKNTLESNENIFDRFSNFYFEEKSQIEELKFEDENVDKELIFKCINNVENIDSLRSIPQKLRGTNLKDITDDPSKLEKLKVSFFAPYIFNDFVLKKTKSKGVKQIAEKLEKSLSGIFRNLNIMDLKNMESYTLVFDIINDTFNDLRKCKDLKKYNLQGQSPHTNVFAFLLYKISILIESEFGEYNYFSNYKELYEKVNATAYLIEEQETVEEQEKIINDARQLQSYNIALYSLIFSMFASYAFIDVKNFNKLQELNDKRLTKAIENKKASQLINQKILFGYKFYILMMKSVLSEI